MERQYKNYAFISYKREDEKWAKWLQKQLEHYRFPANLNGRTDLPQNIRPTFRDITDLTPGLLADEIGKALQDSEWLIVICSPRSAKSSWVCKEAQAFIDQGRADHIIPFIIEGIPFSENEAAECYPKALLKLTGNRELLAANINEMGRDAAAIKVVARMFNLRFDILWQRHEREHRRRRWLWFGISFFITLIGLSIGAYFIWQNQIIESQKNQLEDATTRLREDSITLTIQNDSIILQNNVILNQRDSIELSIKRLQITNQLLEEERDNVLKANRDLKHSNAIIVAENALSLLNSGDILRARRALSSICSDESALQLCSLTNVEYALRKVYREFMREGIRMRFSLDNIGKISFARLDETGDCLYVIINDSLVVEYDAKLGLKKNVINAIPNSSDLDVWIYDFDIVHGNLYYTIDDSVVYIKNIYAKGFVDNNRSFKFEADVDHIIVSPQYNYIICCIELKESDDLYYEYHLVNLCENEVDDYIIPKCEEVYGFSSDGRRIVADIDGKCCIYNLEYKHIENVIPNESSLKEAKFIGDAGRYILLQRYVDKHRKSVSVDVYDILSGEMVDFAYKLEGEVLTINNIEISPKGNRMISADYDGNLTVYDIGLLPYYDLINDDIRISGRSLESLVGHSEEVESISFNKSGTRMLTFSNGRICVWDVNVKDVIEALQEQADFIASNGQCYIKFKDGYARLYDVTTNNPIGIALFKLKKEFSFKSERVKMISRNQNIVVTTKEDSLISIYDLVDSKWFSIPFNCHEYSLNLSIDRDGERLAVWDSSNGNKYCHSLKIYDLKNKKEVSKDNSIMCADISISPDGEHIAVSTGSEIILYYTGTLKQKMKFPEVHSGYICSICYSPDGNYIVSASWDRTVCLWDAQNGALIKTFYGAERGLWDCSISCDGEYIIASTVMKHDIINYVWDVRSEEIVEIIKSESRYSFCQDVRGKLFSNQTFLDFPSKKVLIDYFKEGE